MGSRRLTPAPAIRAARPGEAALLTELALRSKGYWGYPDEFLARCRAELTIEPGEIADGSLCCRVATLDDVVAGFCALSAPSAGRVELEALFVEPAYIGRGFGRALIEDAIATASKQGADRLVIQGDPNAHAFYIAAGAVETGTRESGSIPGRHLPLYEIRLA